MKIILDSEHLRYFRENQFIEFEALVTPGRLEEINAELDQALAKRTGAPLRLIKSIPPAEIYPYARDLWRESEKIKRFDCQNQFAELISTLLETRRFILGYDQLFVPESKPTMGSSPYYSSIFPRPKTLGKISSVQGIYGALIICLEGEAKEPLDNFPAKPGSVVVIGPEAEIDFSRLEKNYGQRFLFVAYAVPEAVYIYQEDDPGTHFWKNLGYVFGDKLLQKGHPILRF